MHTLDVLLLLTFYVQLVGSLLDTWPPCKNKCRKKYKSIKKKIHASRTHLVHGPIIEKMTRLGVFQNSGSFVHISEI